MGLKATVGAVVLVACVAAATSSSTLGTSDGADGDCMPLGQLPAGCPAKVGPPCPRCYTNPLPDYTPGAALNLSATTRAQMQQRLNEYIALILQERPPSHFDDPTVFSGVAGRALVFLKLHHHTANATYLKLATEYIDTALDHLFEQKIKDKATGYVGFFWSHTGILAVGAAVHARNGDKSKSDELIAQVQTLVDGLEGKYDDFDSGRAGLVYAGQFLNYNVRPDAISNSSLLKLALAIIDRGASLPTSDGAMQWHGPNDNGLWLGVSHGAAGVLHPLLLVPGLTDNATATALIRATLDHLVSAQQPSGNFPTEYFGPTDDVLVQWDHGAPGVSACLFRAADVLGNATYRDSGVKAQECAWKRGLLTKGLMLCHGISGVTYMMINAHQRTGQDVFLYRALQFQEYVLANPSLSDPAQMRQPQPTTLAYELWVGSYLSAMTLWTDLLYNRSPANAHMTGFLEQI